MMEKRRTATLFVAALAVAAVYLCYLLFRPYITPILFACVMAIVFYPLHRYTRSILRSPTGGALVSTLVTLLLTAVPLTFLLLAISNELKQLYQSLAARSAGAGGIIPHLVQALEGLTSWVSQHLSIPAVDLRAIFQRRVESLSSSLVQLSAGLVSNIVLLVANIAIALLVLFFLFRDGERALSTLMEALPLDAKRTSELRTRISSTVTTNFYGSFVVGALQGTLTGLSFWMLGIDSPVLWGVATGVFSLVPFVGSAIVWVPAALVLLFTGHFAKGMILLVLGTTVIGTIDNIVRPLIVHKSVRVHPILVFFSLLGGVRLFGVLGLFVGPVIISVTAALLGMVKEDLASNTGIEDKLGGSV